MEVEVSEFSDVIFRMALCTIWGSSFTDRIAVGHHEGAFLLLAHHSSASAENLGRLGVKDGVWRRGK